MVDVIESETDTTDSDEQTLISPRILRESVDEEIDFSGVEFLLQQPELEVR